MELEIYLALKSAGVSNQNAKAVAVSLPNHIEQRFGQNEAKLFELEVESSVAQVHPFMEA